MPDDLSPLRPSERPVFASAELPSSPVPVPTRWRYQPVSSALWRALYMDGPTLATTLASESAPRLDVLAARAVDLACSGNIKAIGLIADRIEGRVGVRSGETDPASDTAREGMQQVIEEIVTAFTEAKLALADDDLPGDAALDITALDPRSAVPPGRRTHDAIDALGEHPRRLESTQPQPPVANKGVHS